MINYRVRSLQRRQLNVATIQNIQIDIVGGNTFGRYNKISSSETFNMIISDNCMVPFPGHKIVANIVQNGQAREIYTSVRYNHMIVIIDDGIYSITNNISISLVGNLLTSSGYVFIAENDGGQIAFVDGLRVYIFDYIKNEFNIPIIDFNPVNISFQDTYFIAADGNSNQWRLSDNNNGNLWPNDAQHVGTLETKPTNVVACIPLDRQLFIFGNTVCEPWYDVGYTLFPYQRSNFYNIDYGCNSPETIASAFGMMVWLGTNEKSGYSIMMSQGGQATKISTDGIDFFVSKLKNPIDSFGFLSKIDGHIFYTLTFREDNKTFIYDFNTGKFFTLTDENLNHHIAKRITFFNNKYYFISFIDGNLYEINSEYTSYNGNTIPRGRICESIRMPDSSRFIVNNIKVIMESGNKNYLQRIELQVSHDGGYSFLNPYIINLNEYSKRESFYQFWRLGITNDLTLKFNFWSKDRFIINSASMQVYQ